MDKEENQPCPICGEKKCTLTQEELDIPYFGKTYVFGMECKACGFHMSDVEADEAKDPVKIEFTTEKAEDMNVRLVKSSEATVRIPALKLDISPGPDAEGYVTNIEGLLHRIKKIIEQQRDAAAAEDDDTMKTTAKNLLKKIWKIECGDIPMKIVIEDPTGNSAIISEKAVKEKLTVKKKKA